jgi:peptidoglycan/LPS O-acetylase OafA/YrhL
MKPRAPQLDSIRAIAVSLVVVHHWADWAHGLGLGNIGVQLFFVLSGFLITGILLKARVRLQSGPISILATLATFHLSRIARIWPVAFLTLGLVFAAGDRFEQRGDIGWHVLFGSNILFFLRGAFSANLSHFWSLAVEQQFYLVWPFLVLLVPHRALEPVILGLVALAPATRVALYGAGFTDFAQFNVLPFASFDSLGLGALVALWLNQSQVALGQRWQLLTVLAAIAGAGIIALHLRGGWPANPEQTLFATLFAWVIKRSSTGFAGVLGVLLTWPPLVWLGTISYGVYVYHMFAPRIVGAALRGIAAPVQLQSGAPLFLLSTAATLAVATLSWRFLERPILTWRQSALTVADAQTGQTLPHRTRL